MTRPQTHTQGDETSITSVLAALAPELVAFMQHHAGDTHLGADIAQDALVQALQSLPELRDASAVRGWVYRIAINRFNDHVRRRRIIHWEGEPPDHHAAPSATRPEREALTRELDRELRDQLLQLPERQRTVLMLHSVRGLSQSQIAQLLGISIDAVKMGLFHAREKMRVRLEQYLGAAPEKRSRGAQS
jgi:RNA polymerase sigma factor (sigma-70 family)